MKNTKLILTYPTPNYQIHLTETKSDIPEFYYVRENGHQGKE